MARNDELRMTAESLTDSVVVCGVGYCDASLADVAFPHARYSPASALSDHVTDSTAAVVIGVDPAASGAVRGLHEALALRSGADPSASPFTVAVLPCAAVEGDTLAEVREHVDGLLLADSPASEPESTRTSDATARASDSGARPPASGASGARSGDGSVVDESLDPVERGIRELLAAVQRPGFVNLDLTDARTVLSAGVAAIGSGTSGCDSPGSAVDAAFHRLPSAVDVDDATAVLVDVVVDPVTSITAATDAISAVRERIDGDANVIWGGAVDESTDGELTVCVVVADVRYSPAVVAGDPCPRCGTTLSAYAFGARSTLSCDGCGFSGIDVRRG